MYIGNKDAKILIGNSKVSKIYLGSVEIYSSGPPKWPRPVITLDGDILSTEVVEGVTQYEVYSDGDYIGYIDPDGTWHGEAPEPPEPVLVAGLYDENDNFIVSYEESGLDATIDFTGSTYQTDSRSGYSTMLRYTNTRKIVLPNGVTSIGNYAFYATDLTSVTIPNSVTSIGNYAFFATYLPSVTIPSSVQDIGYCAFMYCFDLASVTFADNSQCSSIGEAAFEDCTNLTNIYVPWAEGAVAGAPWGATNATIHYNWTPTPTPSGYTVTLSYGVAETAQNGATRIKFGTPPTSETDYDYVSSYGYDTPRCLYDKAGNSITSPVTIENVTTCYIFAQDDAAYRIVEGTANISGNSYETTSYGADATEYGQLIRIHAGDFSNPDVVTLTSDVTLKILATED